MTSKEQILSLTHEGKDVFVHYFGEIPERRLFRNVFRQDSSPSCKLYLRDGRYILHDFGSSEWNGDCFTVAAKINKLDCATRFADVLSVIIKELGLYVLSFDKTREMGNLHVLPRVEAPRCQPQATPNKVTTVCKPFSEEELSYWDSYGIGLDVLERYDVRSVEVCHFQRVDGTRYSIYGTKKSPTYAYLFGGGKGVKLYRPKDKIRFLYGGTLPKPYVFGLSQLSERGDTLFVTGGEKDVMSLAAHGFSAISLNSETASIPDAVIAPLAARFRDIIIMYDADDTGMRESAARLSDLRQRGYDNVCRLVLPLAGTKEDKDISDFFSTGCSVEHLRMMINQTKRGC